MLLALDTATATASVAVFDTEQRRLLAETTWQARRRHTQDLMVMIERTLEQADVCASVLHALAVTTGPGSFTGVRIGISAAKGLGLGLERPPLVIGLPTLCVTAATWLEAAGSFSPPVTVCAFIQAGRGRYNWAWFTSGDRLARPGRDEHSSGTAEEFRSELSRRSPNHIWLAGEWDDELNQAVIGLEHVRALDSVSALRRAGNLARLAALHLAAGTRDDLASLQPLYLRNP